MPVLPYKGFDAHYVVSGDAGAPLMVFVNGLTMRAGHWDSYAAALEKAGYRALAFDLLGQGMSAKPILQLRFEENEDLLIALLDHLGVDRAYVCGISYGGVVVLQSAIRFPERIKGIVPMSTFAAMDATLSRVSLQLYDAMVRGSFESLLNWFATFNFSPERLAAVADRFDATRRTNAAANDVYAIQNLMESLKTFQGFTADLPKIACPTLILNGEFDGLTPRRLHEPMRAAIANSRLMLIQRGYHAFSMELPEIVERIVVDFIRQVESGQWVGDQTVWIAEDSPTSPRIAFPCPGDHTRGIPVMKPAGPPAPARYSPADSIS